MAKAGSGPTAIDDPLFARGYARSVNRVDLESRLESAFRRKDSAYWIERLRQYDVPASVVQEYAEMAVHEQTLANGYIVEQEHPRFGTQRVVGLHVKLSETPGAVGAPAPLLGEHTAEVLLSAGYSAKEIEALAAAGVINAD